MIQLRTYVRIVRWALTIADQTSPVRRTALPLALCLLFTASISCDRPISSPTPNVVAIDERMCSGKAALTLLEWLVRATHATGHQVPGSPPADQSHAAKVAGHLIPLGWSCAPPWTPLVLCPSLPQAPSPATDECGAVPAPAGICGSGQQLPLAHASASVEVDVSCCRDAEPNERGVQPTRCRASPRHAESNFAFGRALWVEIRAGALGSTGLSAEVDDFCLQTTPAGLIGHYRLDLTVASAAPSAEPARGHAEIQHDAASDTWTLHVADVPEAPGWQLADQDAAALAIGDGFVDFALAFANAATGETASVAVHLDSVASRLDGSSAPAGGAAAAGPAGTLVLQACVNDDYPGPC